MKRPLGTLVLPLAALLSHPPAAIKAQEPDDAAIAHIAVTANRLDITGAEQALERSSNDEVRAFAQTMIRDHTGVIEKAAALAERLGVTPKDNATSRALAARAADVRRDLAELRGPAFDRAYMENEVAYHETVITAVEGWLERPSRSLSVHHERGSATRQGRLQPRRPVGLSAPPRQERPPRTPGRPCTEVAAGIRPPCRSRPGARRYATFRQGCTRGEPLPL